MSVKVTFARDYTDWSGKNHHADASAALDESEADHVLRLGYARPGEDKPAAKKAAAPKTAESGGGRATTGGTGTTGTTTSKES